MTLEISIEMIAAQGEAMKEFGPLLQEIENPDALRFITKFLSRFRAYINDQGSFFDAEVVAMEIGAEEAPRDARLSKKAAHLGITLHQLLTDEKLTMEDADWIGKLLWNISNGIQKDQTA